MSQRDRLLDHIRRLALQGMGERQTDGQLLESFISKRDEAAFALLLRRHGAMVWSVCRRILGNSHDADDAFQAAFLVLVRKADSVRPREAVGNWLYGVAYRTALEARGRIARRRAKEQSLQDVPPPESKPEGQWQELGPILDRELSRLADKYRLPIVLCDLEGRSRKEVAEQLAIPEGTLSSRLATGRKKLAARLARHGFTVTGVSAAALLTESAATATVAPPLFASTTKAALLIAATPAAAGIVSATVSTLTEGVIKTMFIAKIKTATLVLCGVAALGVGTGGVYYQTRVGAADAPQLDRLVQNRSKSTFQPGERDTDKTNRLGAHLSLPQPLNSGDVKNLNQNDSVWIDFGGQIWTAPDGAKYRVLLAPLVMDMDNRLFVPAAGQAGQDNRKKNPKSAEDDIGKLKQENELLRSKLHELEKALLDMRIQGSLQANPASQSKPEKPAWDSPQGFKELHDHLRSLDKEAESLREAFQRELNAMQRKQRDLERDLQNRLVALEQKKVQLMMKVQPDLRSAAEFKNQFDPTQPSGDKPDRVLQRLERLEKRLDRLEKGKP